MTYFLSIIIGNNCLIFQKYFFCKTIGFPEKGRCCEMQKVKKYEVKYRLNNSQPMVKIVSATSVANATATVRGRVGTSKKLSIMSTREIR